MTRQDLDASPLKTQHAPDLTTVCDAIRMAQIEAKAVAENNTQALSEIRNELKNTTETIRQTTTIAQQTVNMRGDTRAAAREAATVGKTTMEITREMKIKGLQSQTGGPRAGGSKVYRIHRVSEHQPCKRNVMWS